MMLRGLANQKGAGGVAIIFALMVVAIVSAIAVKQSWRSDLDLTRAGHRWMSVQAKAYAEGAEALAIIALQKDLEDSKIDHLQEDWALGYDFPTDHGSLQASFVDAQSRLNLNNLGVAFKAPQAAGQNNNPQQQVGHVKYLSEHLRFIRLLQTIPLDEQGSVMSPNEAELILEAVKDWVDPDDKATGFGGAEQNYYDQLDPPITIPNGPMVSASELRFVRGMTSELYVGLRPFVSVLPDPQAGLNVNTMGPWIARTLNDDKDLQPLTVEDGQQFFSDINSAVPEKHDDLIGIPLVDTLFPKNAGGQILLPTDGLVYGSSWFELQTTVTIDDHIRRSRSLIDRRESGNLRVVKRSDTGF